MLIRRLNIWYRLFSTLILESDYQIEIHHYFRTVSEKIWLNRPLGSQETNLAENAAQQSTDVQPQEYELVTILCFCIAVFVVLCVKQCLVFLSWPNFHPWDSMYVPCLGKSKYWFWHFWRHWWLFTAALQKSETVDTSWGLSWRLDLEREKFWKDKIVCWIVSLKPLEDFLEIQPFQLEIQTHKSWLPPECQFYGDNPISYFPARHFQTLRSGKCF